MFLAWFLDMGKAFDNVNYETLTLYVIAKCGRLKISLSSGFVATLVTDEKWYESIQHCLSPCA